MELTLERIARFAGEFEDGSDASVELRDLLQNEATTNDIEDLLDEALAGTESYHNRALQDIVNSIGQRLGFDVEYGPYRPNTNPRYDGLWQSSDLDTDEDAYLVTETKSTTGYQIDPNKQPGEYMDELAQERDLEEDQVYGLIVVGGNGSKIDSVVDSVRGSEYRKRIRVITCRRLFTLLEMADEGGLSKQQTAQVLLPMDTVNVGSLVELIEKIVTGTTEPEPEPDPPDDEFGERVRQEAGVVRNGSGDIEFQPMSEDVSKAERLRRVVGVAIDQGHITRSDLPYAPGSAKTRCLVNSESKHLEGQEMQQPFEIRSGFYVETNRSTENIKQQIDHLFDRAAA